MKILAIEAATASCSAAVLAGGTILAREWRERAPATEALAPMIARVMAAAGVSFADLDRLAATTGPGHFTGLRAGLAVLRGLALATGLPAVAVGTLEAVAAGTDAATRAGRRVLAALDSKREEPYLQLFDAGLAPLGPPAAMTPDAFAASLAPGPPLVVAGDAAAGLVAALGAAGIAAAAIPPRHPDAAWVARLAAARAPAAGPLAPLYLHPPAAKIPVPPRGPA